MKEHVFLHEISQADVGRTFASLPGCASLGPEGDGWGEVAQVDVGKRLYHVDGVVQMENLQQLKARLWASLWRTQGLC